MKMGLCTAVLLIFSGCSAVGLVVGNTEFHLEFDHSGKLGSEYYALKAIPGTDNDCNGAEKFYSKSGQQLLETRYYQYGIIDSHCYMDPKNSVPEKLVIQFTPFLTSEQIEGTAMDTPSGKDYGNIEMIDRARLARDKYIAAIPTEKWTTIVIYPRQMVEKYRHKKPEGDLPLIGSTQKELYFEIKMLPNSQYQTREYYGWKDKKVTSSAW